jgi:hypothetical protein
MKKLQTLLNDIEFESMPAAWTTFDLGNFSKSKKLWDYQQKAVENALKALWKYYADDSITPALAPGASVASAGRVGGALPPYRDQAKQSPRQQEIASSLTLFAPRNDDVRKEAFYQWYTDNQVELGNISLGKKRDNATMLAPYYPVVDSRISYANFINRMGFWMATGSGKTLVIVKLIEILSVLMRGGEIPNNDILVLTHREDLLQQLRDHVNEYNASGGSLFIRLKELKEYSEVKRGFPSLLGHQEITVFFYRSDNMSDEQKERIVDFHNYENNGRWYVLLDEAHKGDKDDSKRQHIYNILSRNGFLFNFSATFTDDRDKLTTAAEFNLSSFIEAGYGKHISILKQENSAFRKGSGDFTDEEKQKIVLQSLLMMAYINKTRESLLEATGTELYHRPLLLALVNSVNTDDADLKIFFAQLERIAKGDPKLRDTFSRAKSDLWDELKAEPEWLYEDSRFAPDQSLFQSLTLKDVLTTVFNSDNHSEIEVLTRPSNDKELAFKLVNCTSPFALIRIGNTAEWLKDVLAGYQFAQGFETESFFQRINEEDSEINMLMGSRSFYEGWDSNRPNVITFVNIGGADAKKFILQSVGRGVRIEPIPNKRKRLVSLDTAKEVDHLLFTQARPFLPAIETLFIFGTNRAALESVFKELDNEKEKEEGVELALEVNPAAIDGRPLLIPTYRYANQPLIEQRAPSKFDIPQEELDFLNKYLAYLGDERLLLAHHDLSPQQIGYVQKSVADPDTYFNTSGGRKFGNINILLPRLTRYLDIIPSELEGFKTLDTEINHYKHIRVLLKDIEELRKKIKAVQQFSDPESRKTVLKRQLNVGEIDIDAYTAAIEGIARTSAEETFTPPQGATLKIKNIAAHYYMPLLVSEDEKIDYIRHVIHVESEVKFVKQLDDYLQQDDNLFKSFDWWLFSRADETLDKVVIPYYDPSQNKMREFHPDFIFWLKRWNDYFILFVDPKGMKNTDYQFKIDGYKDIFWNDGKLKAIPYRGLNVRVSLAMFNKDASQSSQGYSDCWYDHPKQILKKLIEPLCSGLGRC